MIIDGRTNLEQNVSNILFSTVPANDLEQLVARTSAGKRWLDCGLIYPYKTSIGRVEDNLYFLSFHWKKPDDIKLKF